MKERKYPIGIQTFANIIEDGYLYIDKTDLVWQLAHYAKYIFMSRPRRFGKSLLTSTLESYFLGERHLFEGLKIMQLEQEWQQYAVLRLDISTAKGKDNADELRRALMLVLSRLPYYDGNADEHTPGERLTGMIQRAYQQTNRQVVVIIDEYDAPLLEVLHEEENLPAYRKVMQELYVPLKANERYIKFCFITGITKFSQMSIFSTINNLANVTLDPVFNNICGITEQEIATFMREDIQMLADTYGVSYDEMHNKLKTRYDGYHFAKNSDELYNLFSLLKACLHKEVANYWFESATPTYLIRQMQHFRTDITTLDSIEMPASAFDRPTEAMTTALPLLYQSGYLTIKGYDRESMLYTLAIPNQEVRIGYTEGLLPIYTGLDGADVQTGFALKFWRALKKGDPDLAMREMQTYLAGVPYVEGFKQKLKDAATSEGFFEYTLYLIFSMLNIYVRTQVKCAGGRTDMVVWMPDTVYVFELKVNDTAENALRQIDDRGYAIPYRSDSRRVVKVGVRFNADTRAPEEWVIAD
ncbi:MAG: AAA family ATPase [Prevotella sp.]|nr:AAA family ATPase [Prevotella sp.]